MAWPRADIGFIILLACVVADAFQSVNEDTQLLQMTAVRPPSVSAALNCLRKTNSSVRLEYPNDAEEHFEEIRRAMAPWGPNVTRPHCGPGHCGPWIENFFIKHFGDIWDKRAEGTRLSEFFGPYIPLLVPWTDNFVWNHWNYPKKMIRAFMEVYRPNVPYIVLCQNDEGFPAKEGMLRMDRIPNVLVLSAGGYGHVPVPLIKQLEPLASNTSMQDRELLVNYVGDMTHAPDNLRRDMGTAVEQQMQELRMPSRSFVGKTGDWKSVMARSCVSLVPRGFGRTAYHLAETMQMGRIPAYVYSDGGTPWIPYAKLFPQFGFLSELHSVKGLVANISRMSDAALERMEGAVREIRSSHFLPEGILHQVSLFMREASGDLECQELPDSVRGP